MSDKRKIDPELFNTFVEDTLEEISVVENQLIKLEKTPDNHDLINSILRPIHSAKGNCSFFGLVNGKKLAHTAEDVLNCALKNKNVINKSVINAFITCIDLIQKLLKNVRDGGEELDKINDRYQKNLSELEATRDRALNQSFDPQSILSKLSSIQNELGGLSDKHAQDLAEIIGMISKTSVPEKKEESRRGKCLELIQDMRNIFTGNCDSALNQEQSDSVGEMLNKLSELSENTTGEELIKEAIDQYRNITQSVGFEPFLAEIIEEQFVKFEAVIEEIPDGGEAKEQTTEDLYDFTAMDHFELTQDEINDLLLKRYKSEDEPEKQEEQEAQESNRSMRVSESSVDNFLESVGKLIVVREMYNNLHRRVSSGIDQYEIIKQLKRINETFFQLSERLNDSVMEIRKISVAGLLQKVPRIVRDVANDRGKNIQVKLIGEDVLIDKRLIETLDAPLIHLIRNAADHGIETPEIRQESGKPEEGQIIVEFALNADNVILTIKDDGKGLDLDAIMQKAIAMDLISPEIELSQKEKEKLIFLPGLTTSKSVTEISGRGVGMDVVKQNIEEAGGKISIETTLGRGTTFTIKLPQAVMTQIINGYVIRVENNQYILPMESVQEIFRITTGQITSVTGKGMCIKRRDQLLTIIRPFCPFEYEYNNDQQISLVTVENNNKHIALHVDEAIGVQRVVLNTVKGLNVSSEVFTASAIMGDGSIAMVINPKHIWSAKVN